jgi:hypothetical protein
MSCVIDEIRSVLVDDGMMKKGDRVFCIMEEGSYAPGRILEMRKKSAQANKSPYAVVKLVGCQHKISFTVNKLTLRSNN